MQLGHKPLFNGISLINKEGDHSLIINFTNNLKKYISQQQILISSIMINIVPIIVIES